MTPDLSPSMSIDRALITVDVTSTVLAGLRAFAIPMRAKFRGTILRQGALIQGPAGWGEFSPFPEYGPRESARWLASALESATVAGRSRCGTPIPVNVTVPAVGRGAGRARSCAPPVPHRQG